MSDTVFEIPDEVGSAAGWTPGTPGNDLSTDTPATSWALPVPSAPVSPHRVEEPPTTVYSVEAGQEAVLGWTPTPAPTSRRAARLASALQGGGRPALTPWNDPRVTGETVPSSSTPGTATVTAPTVVAPVATTPATAQAAPAPAASGPAAPGPLRPPAGTSFADTARAFASGTVPVSAPTSGHHLADEPAPAAVDDARSRIELHEHARTVAHRGLVEALCEVVLQGGSDLHVTTDAVPTLRVDGGLRPAVRGAAWDAATVRSALTSLLTPEQAAQFDEELELDFAWSLSDESRFRVNVYQQRGSMGAAFRLIPTEIRPLHELGVPEVVSRFAKLPRGLVLVTGPTGSGKSTTLAALIDLVNRTRADHVVTVEDPIEFLHPHKKAIVNQREVGQDTHSFAAALKHVLRQDPDVILIGELRDLETISVALTAAETGHLVFATLHTQSAAQTIDRVIDVFPPYQQDQVRTQLAATLQGVICQTLVPRAGGRGRVVATEIMMMTPAIGNLVREGKTYQIPSAMQAGRDLGMHTLDQKLADLVNTGVVTHRAAMEKVHDAEGFDRLVTRVINSSETQGLDGGIDFGDAFSGGHD
ncbi:type IV pilus twitching motility protein PilT [Frigoribacterium salinisoli]